MDYLSKVPNQCFTCSGIRTVGLIHLIIVDVYRIPIESVVGGGHQMVLTCQADNLTSWFYIRFHSSYVIRFELSVLISAAKIRLNPKISFHGRNETICLLFKGTLVTPVAPFCYKCYIKKALNEKFVISLLHKKRLIS